MKSKHKQHAYAHKKAKRSGKAERSGKGEFGDLPRLLYNTTRPIAQQAKLSGEGAYLPLQCNTPTPRSENESDFKLSAGRSEFGAVAKEFGTQEAISS
jgi:hypothetical protein